MPAERVVAHGPGRVNLIGEHTDYNGGLSLPFAIAAGVTVTATARADGLVVARALDRGESDRFALADPEPAPGWRAFLRGTVAELAAAGLPVRPAELEIHGDVPEGAGLSSSAALGVALCLALLALGGAPDADRLELARVCSRVENAWVGARTGLLDQIASLFGRDGHALRVDFRTLDVAPVALQTGSWRLVTVGSGEARLHAASGYNERRRECAVAAERLGLRSLRDATAAAAAELPDPLCRRVRHVIEENGRVDATVAALRAGDLRAVGALLDASHASLRDLYDASTPAVERTVAALREAGAAGARMVGGGFGGHVLALLPPDAGAPAGAREVAPAAGARLLQS
ncbi:MAG TPA: galactokinase family protein [Solirubrobacteraceae bacterium]